MGTHLTCEDMEELGNNMSKESLAKGFIVTILLYLAMRLLFLL